MAKSDKPGAQGATNDAQAGLLEGAADAVKKGAEGDAAKLEQVVSDEAEKGFGFLKHLAEQARKAPTAAAHAALSAAELALADARAKIAAAAEHAEGDLADFLADLRKHL